MPFGYIQDDVAVEVFASQPFTTPTLKVAADEAEYYDVATGTVIDHPTTHPAGNLIGYGPSDLERYGIQEFDEASDPPEGQVVDVRTLVVTSGVISATATYKAAPAPEVPEIVSAMQLQQALLDADLLDAVETAVVAAPREVQIYWDKTSEFHRHHPTMETMIATLGMTSEEADAIFLAASQVT